MVFDKSFVCFINSINMYFEFFRIIFEYDLVVKKDWLFEEFEVCVNIINKIYEVKFMIYFLIFNISNWLGIMKIYNVF